MADGKLYKYNATTFSKSVCKKFNATTVSDGVVKHANATTWFKNYPMEQIYEQYFNVVWTQGYKNDGTILDAGVWGDHPRAGGSAAFVGMWGFDNTAMRNFVGTGVIQEIKVEVMFDDPDHAGNPWVEFYPHVNTSKPGTWNANNANRNFMQIENFVQTQSDYTRWIGLPVGAWLGGQMAGMVCNAPATAANSCRFAGKTTSHSLNSFNTRLYIKVLK